MAIILALAIIQENERVPRNLLMPPRAPSFRLDDEEFISNFRLNKSLAHQLIEELRVHLDPKTARRNAFSTETKDVYNWYHAAVNESSHDQKKKYLLIGLNGGGPLCAPSSTVLTALRFFATGSYQKSVANDYLCCMSQTSVSNCVRQVADAMTQFLLQKYVKFPTERREQEKIKMEFQSYCNLSGVIGAIDCTHVAIIAPPNDGFHHERNYVNRKGWHSLNVQLVCDVQQRILNAVARFPGCTHDAYIWKSCNLRLCFQNYGYIQGNGWLLGDSGYPAEPWLKVPISNAQNADQRNYNAAQSLGRSIIEQCNGNIKTRFRCLLKHRTLNYSPEMSAKIIYSCTILHNMCIDGNLDWEECDLDEEDMMFNTTE